MFCALLWSVFVFRAETDGCFCDGMNGQAPQNSCRRHRGLAELSIHSQDPTPMHVLKIISECYHSVTSPSIVWAWLQMQVIPVATRLLDAITSTPEWPVEKKARNIRKPPSVA